MTTSEHDCPAQQQTTPWMTLVAVTAVFWGFAVWWNVEQLPYVQISPEVARERIQEVGWSADWDLESQHITGTTLLLRFRHASSGVLEFTLDPRDDTKRCLARTSSFNIGYRRSPTMDLIPAPSREIFLLLVCNKIAREVEGNARLEWQPDIVDPSFTARRREIIQNGYPESWQWIALVGAGLLSWMWLSVFPTGGILREPWEGAVATPWSRKEPAIILGLLLLSAGLRFASLRAFDIEPDECGLSPRPVLSYLNTQETRFNPPGYFMVARGLLLIDRDVVWVRGFSALLGTLTVGVLFAFVRRIYGLHVAILAALHLAASPAHVYISQIARAYALAGLLSCMAWGALMLALRYGGRWWSLLVICLGLGLWTHYLFTLVLVMLAVFWLIIRKQVTLWWPLPVAMLLALGLATPLGYHFWLGLAASPLEFQQPMFSGFRHLGQLGEAVFVLPRWGILLGLVFILPLLRPIRQLPLKPVILLLVVTLLYLGVFPPRQIRIEYFALLTPILYVLAGWCLSKFPKPFYYATLFLLTPMFFVTTGSYLFTGKTPFGRLPSRSDSVIRMAAALQDRQPAEGVVIVSPAKYAGCLAYHWLGAYDLEGEEPSCNVGDRWPQHEGKLIVGVDQPDGTLQAVQECTDGLLLARFTAGSMDVQEHIERQNIWTVVPVIHDDHWSLLKLEEQN